MFCEFFFLYNQTHEVKERRNVFFSLILTLILLSEFSFFFNHCISFLFFRSLPFSNSFSIYITLHFFFHCNVILFVDLSFFLFINRPTSSSYCKYCDESRSTISVDSTIFFVIIFSTFLIFLLTLVSRDEILLLNDGFIISFNLLRLHYRYF